MTTLSGKTLFVTGATRGIGLAIAKRAAADGARIVVAAKTKVPHPKLPGTIYTAAEEIVAAGGEALPVVCDIRSDDQVEAAVAAAVERFGGIDVLVNNASAISLTGTLETPMKRVDLMLDVNLRGTYTCSRACLPHLLEAENPHILNLAPPLPLRARWFRDHTAYSIAKFGMSMCVLGMAEEFRDRGVAVNALWPRTLIDTAALNILGDARMRHGSRNPEIVADAAHRILIRPARECSGNFFLDEDVLREAGVTDLDRYATEPGRPLITDLFVEPLT